MANEKLTFEQFAAVIGDALMTDPANLTPDKHFINDLAVDSIALVELYLKLQEIGMEIPQDAVWQIQTIGDAYRFYANGQK